MRGLAVTVVVALAACGAALAGGWGVQTALLPRAEHGDRIAADASALLLRYRVTASSITVGGRREEGLCLHAWFPRRNGTLGRGTLLLLENGDRIAADEGGVEVEGPRRLEPRSLRVLLLELAGCPGVVGGRTAAAAISGGVRVTRAFAGGQPALGLQLPTQVDRLRRHRLVRDQLTLYVSPRTYHPLAVAASLGSLEGVARVHLLKATPALLARFAPPIARATRVEP